MKKIYTFLSLIFCFAAVSKNSLAQQLPPALGDYNVTAFADTLANIYVDYIEKDIDIYFFENFSRLLNDNPELRTIFPNTSVYLSNIPNYQYTTMLQTLRLAFFKDLKKLPADIASIPSLDTAECCNSASSRSSCQSRVLYLRSLFNTERGKLLVTGLYLADAAINKTGGPTVINNIATNYVIANDTSLPANLVKLLNLFSTSLESPDNPGTWMSLADWKNLTSDQGQLSTFITNLYANAQNQHIQIGKINVTQYLSEANEQAIIDYADTLLTYGYSLDSAIRSLRIADTSAKDRAKNVASFLQNMKGFFDAATNFHIVSNDIPPTRRQVARIFADINNSLDIAKFIVAKDYRSAVFSGLVLIDSLMPTKQFTNMKGKTKISSQQVSRRIQKDSKAFAASLEKQNKINYLASKKTKAADTAKVALALSALRDSNDPAKLAAADSAIASIHANSTSRKETRKYMEKNVASTTAFKQNFFKYGALLADVVMADSSSQITAAFEAAAEPPGSSIVKKTTNFSINLQGYGGFSAGFSQQHFSGNFFGALNSPGPYAPLGISVSVGLKHRNTTNKSTWGSLSLFFSLIDIGSIVQYDLRNKSVNSPDTTTVRLANIFAPGVNLVYGIPGVPLSVGGGFQYVPMLTQVSENSTATTTTSGYRWQLFAAFDLSFFNLYVSRR